MSYMEGYKIVEKILFFSRTSEKTVENYLTSHLSEYNLTYNPYKATDLI